MTERLPLKLNPPQREVLERGFLTSGFDVVLQMPTGAGKTWLAEQAIRATLDAGHRAIYLTPLRALANELLEKWRHEFAGWDVGVFTGDYRGGTYPVAFDEARLLVMTPERLDACTRRWRSHWKWLPEVSLVVVDELHLLGDASRGPRLEGALMRARRLNPFLRLLGLSATLGNRREIADWLGGVEYASTWRPIPITWRCVRFRTAGDKPAILEGEVVRCIAEGGQSLIFVQSRRRAEIVSAQLRAAGIATGHHHGGLEANERKSVEAAYRDGTLCALVSTGTLEMGLNLPARQVVLYDLQKFDGADFIPLSVSTVWQRAGRAGRLGLDTKGDVVLLAPTWDRDAQRYEAGEFEPTRSGMVAEMALAEQLLVEISAGLARTRSQLARSFEGSLAAHQGVLPPLDRTLDDMLDSGMLVEVPSAGDALLQPTRLGRIAVRHMISPSTLVAVARRVLSDEAGTFTLLDLLLVCVATDECDPLLSVDFEEVESLAERLSSERSVLLSGMHGDIRKRIGLNDRRLLSAIKTTLLVRAWTRSGSSAVTEEFNCYPYELHRIRESVTRILTAVAALLVPHEHQIPSEDAPSDPSVLDEATLLARVQALLSMVEHGVDEQAVTLTFINGIGGKLARRLCDSGVKNIEDLAQADASDLARLRGISEARANSWIEEAARRLPFQSALTLVEVGEHANASSQPLDSAVDPYRLRRALDLRVGRDATRTLTVTGGLEPHRVRLLGRHLRCDCGDFGAGNTCKHVLAVRLQQGDRVLSQLVERLLSAPDSGPLDLFMLWNGKGERAWSTPSAAI